MKRFLLLFLTITSIDCSGASSALSSARMVGRSVSYLTSWCTYKTAHSALAATTAVVALYLHRELMNMVKNQYEKYQKRAQDDPVSDCPVKRKIAAKFAQHGYEVIFVRERCGSTDNAAVLAYGKKVIFLVFDDGTHTFFNDPRLDAARDGIIEHEIAHVLHGDTARMMRYLSCTVPLALAAALYTGIEVSRCDLGAVIKSISTVSCLPTGLSYVSEKTRSAGACCIPEVVTSAASHVAHHIPEKFKYYGHAVTSKTTSVCKGLCRCCLGLISTTATSHVTLGGTILGSACLSRYQEKCADYAAVKCQDPNMLEGMADFFKRLGNGVTPHSKKSWRQWWWDNFVMSHPCCHERCRYLQAEAAKLRKKGK